MSVGEGDQVPNISMPTDSGGSVSLARRFTAAFALLGSLIAGAAMAADAERGGVLFTHRGYGCIECHPQERHIGALGPSLCDVVGRAAATQPSYDRYSNAMKQSGIVWTPQALDDFLVFPIERLKGTTMGFMGIEAAADRADIIAYMRREGAGDMCAWERLTLPN